MTRTTKATIQLDCPKCRIKTPHTQQCHGRDEVDRCTKCGNVQYYTNSQTCQEGREQDDEE